MRKVTMRHPDLEQPITVPASAAPIHAAAGWFEVDEPAPAPKNKTRKAPRQAAVKQEESA